MRTESAEEISRVSGDSLAPVVAMPWFWETKKKPPKDNCEKFMETYLKCVQGMKQGLSEVEGECLEQKEAYRKCIRESRAKEKKAK